jgi:hypothetical protein
VFLPLPTFSILAHLPRLKTMWRRSCKGPAMVYMSFCIDVQ